MTGETHSDPSGWTPDTLKVLEDEKIAGVERAISAEIRRIDGNLADRDRAQDKFEATVERDSVKQNEFRGALDDLGKQMATRRETEAQFAAMGARMDDLARQLGDLRSRIDIGAPQIPGLQAYQNQQLGRQEGIQFSTGTFLAAIGAVATIAAIVGHFVH